MKTQSASVDNPLLLSVHETARALAISERSVWTLASDGTLPCVRLGKKIVRFDRRDILAMIDARKHRGSGDKALDAISAD